MHFDDDCPCIDPCPMNLMFKLFGGKWKSKIICLLNLNESLRYSELKRRVVGITPTMLANSLRELEDMRIVERKQFDTMPVRVEYSLTEHGRSLVPIMIQMRDWGARYREELESMDVQP